MKKVLRTIATFPIILYQKVISPLIGPACRYYPSCSHYARDAIVRHGIAKGIVLASARILRCSPLFDGGHDPIPRLKTWPQMIARIKKDYLRFWSKNTAGF